MQQSEFEKLIKENEDDLDRIRRKYFPLIDERIITGYNIYPEQFDYSRGELFLNYLHSDLKSEDRHFQELSEILKNHGFLEERMIINNELVDKREARERNADYITNPDWNDPLGVRYFTVDGRELSYEEAEIRRRIIGESLQHDLLIRIKDEKDLRKLVDLFKEYTSKFQLDKNGRSIIMNDDYVENEKAIYNPWEVPLVICTSKDNKKPKRLYDFLRVNQFNMYEKLGGELIILSTLVRAKSKDFQKGLKEKGIKSQDDKKYVLRGFVEDYIDKP